MSEGEISDHYGPFSDEPDSALSSKSDSKSILDYESEYIQKQLIQRARTALAALNCLALRRAICRSEGYDKEQYPSHSGATNIIDELCKVHLDAVEEAFVLDIRPNDSGVDKILQHLDKLAVERCRFVVTGHISGKEYSSGDVTCLMAALEHEHFQEIIHSREEQGAGTYVNKALDRFRLSYNIEGNAGLDAGQVERQVTVDSTETNSDIQCTAGAAYGVSQTAAVDKANSYVDRSDQSSSSTKQTSDISSPKTAGSISPGSLTSWEQSLLRGSPTREEIEAVTQANEGDSQIYAENTTIRDESVKGEPQNCKPAFASPEDFTRRALAFPLGVDQHSTEDPYFPDNTSLAPDRPASPLTKYWQGKDTGKHTSNCEVRSTNSVRSESIYSVRQSDPNAKASVLLRNLREGSNLFVTPPKRTAPVAARSPQPSPTLNVHASQAAETHIQTHDSHDSKLDALPDLGHKVTKLSNDGKVEQLLFVPDIKRISHEDALVRAVASHYEAKMAEREHGIARQVQFITELRAQQAQDLATLKTQIAQIQHRDLKTRERRTKKAARGAAAATVTAATRAAARISASTPVALERRNGNFYLLPTVFEGMEEYIRRQVMKEQN